MRFRPFAAACLLLCATIHSGTLAQGVRVRQFERSNRFEGLIGLPISDPNRPSLDLISFTGFFESFTGPVDLRIAFFLPRSRTETQIVVQELAQDLFYRMESKPGTWVPGTWSEFGPWPTGDVIIPGKVRPSNLGVVVRLNGGLEGREFVAPAFIHQNKVTPSLVTYQVQLRPVRTTFSVVEHLLERVDGARLTTVDKGEPDVERPERRPFRIEVDATTLTEGQYVLTVIGYVKNSTLTVTRQYEFEHRRLPK